MRTSMRHAPDDIDLAALWRLTVRSLPKLLGVAALAGAGTYGLLSLVAPRYASETQISIESKSASNPYTDPSRVGGPTDAVSVRMDKEAINTHVRALQSFDLAEAIVRDMKLDEKVEFNSALGAPDTISALLRVVGIGRPRPGESVEERVINAYFSRLDVYPAKESRVIGIRFSSIEPALAAAIANRIAETYREKLAHQSISETDEVQKALEPQSAKLTEEAAAAEAEVEKFRGEANIFKAGQQATGLNEQQLAELNAELSRTKAARSDAEARANQAREMLAAGSADALPDVQKSPVIQNLIQSRVRVERQISELSATLLAGHPRMRQLNADLAGLKKQINAEIAKIVDSLAKEAKVAAMREDAVTRSLNEVKTRIVNTGPDEAKLRSLEANAKSKRSELERLRAQYEANRVRADDSRTIPVEAHIVSMARPSSVPVFPKKTATALLAAMATLMFGTAIVITRGLLGGARLEHASPRPPADPVFSAPFFSSASLERAPTVASPILRPKSPRRAAREAVSLTELVERLVAMRAGGLGGIRSLVTGEGSAEELAKEAMDIGKAMAQAGQAIIIVDWAPAGGGIAEVLKQKSVPGMVELVEGKAKFEHVVSALGQTGAHLIPAGSAQEPDSLLDANQINFVLDALDDVYDQIVVVSEETKARALLEAIEGRFDCGITIVTSSDGEPVLANAPETFLGYEVDGMELIRYASGAAPKKLARRVMRAVRGAA